MRDRYLVPLVAAGTLAALAAAGWGLLRLATRPGRGGDDGPVAARPEPFTNAVGMRLVPVPAGEFVAGSPADEIGHREPRERQAPVALAKPFFLSAHEVTQAQYQAVTGADPARFKHPDHPVERVTWEEALRFCRLLGDRDGRTYRLPTAAEWEYACRAGTTTPFHTGDTLPADRANYDPAKQPYAGAGGEPRGRPVPVGSFPPNAWGLYDMHGNVAEWCLDVYPGAADYHTVSGGGWDSAAVSCRSAARIGWLSESNPAIGFRVVCTAEPEDAWRLGPAPGDNTAAGVIRRVDAAFARPAAALKPGVLILPAQTRSARPGEPAEEYASNPYWLADAHAATLAVACGPRRRAAVSPRAVARALLRERTGLGDPDIPRPVAGVRLTPDAIGRALAETGLTLTAVPRLDFTGADVVLRVDLRGGGAEYPDRTVEHRLGPGGQDRAARFVARAVAEHLGLGLDPAGLGRLDQVATLGTVRRDLLEGWARDAEGRTARDLVGAGTPLAWDTYLRFTHDRAAAFDRLAAGGGRLPELLDELEIDRAGWLRENGRLREALDLLLGMAPTRRGDPHYHRQLTLCGARLAEPEVVDHLLAVWGRVAPGYPGAVGRGEFLAGWAAEARGSAWADRVTDEGFALFRDRQGRAKAQFEAAVRANPKTAHAHTQLLHLAPGLGLPREAVEAHFAAARANSPDSPAPYFPKFTYLMPRWHGTPDEYLGFARECAGTGRWRSGVADLFVAAVKDLALDEAGAYRREVFRHPDVWPGLKAYFDRAREKNVVLRPDDHESTFADRVGSYYLLWGAFAGRDADLAPALGWITHPDLDVISDYVTYQHLRDRVEAAAGGGATRAVARVRVALAKGDLARAETLLADADLPEDARGRYTRALGLARRLAADGRVTLTARDLVEAGTLRVSRPENQPPDGEWRADGDAAVCRLGPYANASLTVPFPFGEAEVSGTLTTGPGARVAQVVVHAQAELDPVQFRFDPQTAEVGVTRNTRSLAAGRAGAGPQRYAIRVAADGDEFRVGGGPGMAVPGPPVRPGGLGFELYTADHPAELRVGRVEIRLAGR